MVCHLVLCTLRPEITPEEVESMMRRTRMSLLKIDVALSVRCGHVIEGRSAGQSQERRSEGFRREGFGDHRETPEASASGRDRSEALSAAWEFFIAIEVNTLEHLAAYQEHPVYVKYMEEVLKPNTTHRLVRDYEMDPAPNPVKIGHDRDDRRISLREL